VFAIFALSAALKDTDYKNYHAAIDFLQSISINFEQAKNLEAKFEIFSDADYFSCGSVEDRLSSLYDLKSNTLLALKGGYGVMQCMPSLQKEFFNEKRVFAYSDLTALFLALKDINVELFHSPMFTELIELSEKELNSFFCFLKGVDNKKQALLSLTEGLETLLSEQGSSFIENPAYLWGGNLSLLLTSNDYPKAPETYKNILFIEDCFEEDYKLERMIYTALNLGLFDNIDELWLGVSKEANFNIDLLLQIAKEKGFKLIQGIPFGHQKKFTLPIFCNYF
jgi:muramoyltetrapeptide carboxypeptidase LdcA involved in peptidoglycan recycling